MARIEALQRAEKAIGELRRLGLNYDLVELPAPPDGSPAKGASGEGRHGEEDAGRASFDQTLSGS
jgi:hypothetical protein